MIYRTIGSLQGDKGGSKMAKTLSPYQVDVVLENLQSRRQILSAVHDGVESMGGHEERVSFLQNKINELDGIIEILKG